MAKEISTYTHDGMELPFEDWSNTLHSFGDLTSIIQTTHDAALSSAVKAINRMQTMRNWLIGYYWNMSRMVRIGLSMGRSC